jgi:hypothetical protein
MLRAGGNESVFRGMTGDKARMMQERVKGKNRGTMEIGNKINIVRQSFDARGALD